MQGEKPETEETRPRRRVPLWLKIASAVALYVLSIGPLFWFWYESEHLGGNPVIRMLYSPLRLLCAIPIVEDCLNSYINWWIA